MSAPIALEITEAGSIKGPFLLEGLGPEGFHTLFQVARGETVHGPLLVQIPDDVTYVRCRSLLVCTHRTEDGWRDDDEEFCWVFVPFPTNAFILVACFTDCSEGPEKALQINTVQVDTPHPIWGSSIHTRVH